MTLCAGLSGPAFCGDWPMYRHDAQRSAYTDESLAFPLQPAWVYQAAQPPAPAWPEPEKNLNRLDFDYAFSVTVGGGLLFFGSSADDTVRALDAATGAEKWRFTTGGPVRFAPQVEKSKVYFASDDGWVYCLDAGAGKPVWQFHAAGTDERFVGNKRMISRRPVRTGVLVESNIVYFAAGMWDVEGVYLYALDADSGKVIWCNDTIGSGLPRISHAYYSVAGVNPQGAILAGGDILLVPTGRCSPAFFDRQTGRLRYYQPGGGGTGNNGTGSAWVAIDGDFCYMFSKVFYGGVGVCAMALNTLQEGVRGGGGAAQNSTFFPDWSFSLFEGKVSALVRNGRVTSRRAYSLIQAGDAFVAGGDGEVWAEQPADVLPAGKRDAGTSASSGALWRGKVNGRAYELAVAQGRLYASTDRGEITCFASGEESRSGVPAASGEAVSGKRGADKFEIRNSKFEIVGALQQAGMDRGFALVLGDADGQVSMALASQTQIQVINALSDESAAAALRERLIGRTTWYGSRIHVQRVARRDALPFPQFFANAVIVAANEDGRDGARPSTSGIVHGGPRSVVAGLSGKELYRVLRPYGGIMLFPGLSIADAQKMVSETGAPESEIRPSPESTPTTDHLTPNTDHLTPNTAPAIIRGALEGAWDWNSKLPGDGRARWPLRLQWFGEPGPAQLYNRKSFHNCLAGANGIFFVLGDHTLTAVDAYNGWEWWRRPLPFAPRGHGAAFGADAEHVYFRIPPVYFSTTNGVVVQMDARTGRQRKIYGEFDSPPVVSLATPQTWPLVTASTQTLGVLTAAADANGLSLRLSAIAPEAKHQCDWSLGLDLRAPETRFGFFESNTWQYLVFPADERTNAAVWKPGAGTGHPAISITNVAADTGSVTTLRLPWAGLPGAINGRPPESFGFCATLNMRPYNALTPSLLLPPKAQAFLFCNAFADGVNAGWANVFPGGVPHAAAPLPAIVAGPATTLTNAPWKPPAQSAAVKQGRRAHPLTGELTEKFIMGGEGCGGMAFSQSAIFSRAGGLAIYDYDDDSGYRFLGAERPPCAGSSMAAFGVWFAADGGAGCDCSYSYLTSFAMAPAEKRLHEDWAVFGDWQVDTIVRQAALNLGAPGDRRDEQGALWLGFPRPALTKSSSVQVGSREWFNIQGVAQQPIPMALPVPLDIEVAEGFGPYRFSADRAPIGGTERPWLYASGYRGIRKAVLRLNFLKPMAARSVAQPPTLDGRLDESAWGNEPQAVTAAQKTRVYLCHDADRLYVGVFQPVDPKQRMGPTWRTSITNRDVSVHAAGHSSHSVEVFLSDARRAESVCLAVFTGGARYDGLSRSNSVYDARWNADWATAASGDTNGLGFELAVPWRAIESVGLDKATLGMNVQLNSGYNMGEALLRLGGLGRGRCDNYVPVGLDAAPVIPPRQYTVRLHFAEPTANIKAGRRVFDVKIQGQTVLKDFDIVKEIKASLTALVKEFKGVTAADALTLEFTPAAKDMTPENAPVLCGIELAEEPAGGI